METLTPTPNKNDNEAPDGIIEDTSYIDWLENDFSSNESTTQAADTQNHPVEMTPFRHPEAYSEVGGTGPEADKKDIEEELKSQEQAAEAELELAGSAKLRANIRQKANQYIQAGEKLTGTGNLYKTATKNTYLRMRSESLQNKATKYQEKSTTARFRWRRERFARLAIETNNVRKGISSKLEASNDTFRAKNVLRNDRQEKRDAKLESVVNKLIAKRYNFAQLARDERRLQNGTGGSSGNKEKFKRMFVESGVTESLEQAGKAILIRKIAESKMNPMLKSMSALVASEVIDQFSKSFKEEDRK